MTTQTFDGYYVFEADQVLTNDHLNQQFYYLDWQERLTRNKLIGTGIVCGLDITSAADKITISKGSGVTSEGYLIVLESPLNYDYFVQYKGVPQPADLAFGPDLPTGYVLPFFDAYCTNTTVYQLLDSTQYNTQNPLPAGSAALTTLTLSDYAVVLFLELNEKDLKNCDTQDCNDKGEKMEITIRTLLVPVTALPNPFVTSKAKEIKLARYNVPYAPLNNAGDVLTAFYNILTNGVLDNVAAGYAYCYDRYSSLLTDTQNPFSNPGFSFGQQLNKALTDLWSNTNRITVQYLYDYINDLILAYYEFRETAGKALLSQCVGHELDFPLHLVLGAASSNTDDMVSDPYRTYFIYSPIFDAQSQGMDKTRFLFNRMKMLATDFKINTYSSTNNIKITPSHYMDFTLSERCIPFYYKPAAINGVAINQVWNYYKTLNNNDDFILGYNASTYNSDDSIVSPLLYDIEQYNFFRVEGHIGQQYTDVLSYLIAERLKYNLPFDVVAVSAELLNTSTSVSVPECSITDLESEFRLLVTEFLSKLFLCIYKFAILPYDSSNLGLQQGVFTLANNLADPDNNAFINNFNPEFNTYAYGDFYAKYAPFTNIVVPTIGSAYVKFVQDGAISSTGVFTNPVDNNSGQNFSYVLNYNLQFEFLFLVDSMFYLLLNNSLSEIDSKAFLFRYERFNLLFRRFMLIAKEDQSTIFDSCGCECLVTIIERMLVLLAEYQTRLNNYLAQLSFLNYYKKHPGLEHKAGVPKGGTFVLVYHEAPRWIALDINAIKAERTADKTKITMEKAASPADTSTPIETTAINSPVKEGTLTNDTSYTINENTLKLVWDFVDRCADAPPTIKQTIKDNLPPIHVGTGGQFPQIDDGMVIADFYIPYQCCSDCAPIAYVIDNKLNVYTVSGGGSTCATNATSANSGIAPVMLSGSDTDIIYNLYNSSDPNFKVTMTGTGNPLNFGVQTAAGTYTVTAVSTDGNTKVNMNSSAVVTLNQPPTVFNLKSNGPSSYCVGGDGVDIILDGSESGVKYQLFNGTTADPAGPVTGTGTLIDFGKKTTGTYTVAATNPTTGCGNTMNGNVVVTVNPLPDKFNVTPAGTTSYTADEQGVIVGLDGSGPATVNYQLLKDGTAMQGAVVAGTGQAINFGTQTAGTYTVSAADSASGCPQSMTGSAIIVEASALVLNPAAICAGGQGIAVGSPAGGTYASDTPAVATVDPNSGSITTLTAGTAKISYTAAGNTASQMLTINPLPATFNVTPPGTTTYSPSLPGVAIGLDGSGPSTIAYQLYNNGSIVSGALVMGMNGQPLDFGLRPAGTYTVGAVDQNTKCIQTMNGSAVIVQEITVLLDLKLSSLCAGNIDEAQGTPAGGTYASDSPNVAVINPTNGIITTLSGGTAKISYTVQGVTATKTLTVNPVPKITVPPGIPQPIRLGFNQSAQLIVDVQGGAWSTSDPKIIVIADAIKGVIKGGVNSGTATITYTTKAGCSAQIQVSSKGG